MKKLIITLMLMCGMGSIYAQMAQLKLTGTLTMTTGESFTYKIELTDNNDVITGFAYTYDAPNETKVTITGHIDKIKKKISFKETEIISSHNVHTKAFMCLLHASLEYKDGILTGVANGKEADNTACTAGTLWFTDNKEINELFSSHDKYDQVIEMGGRKKDTPTAKPAPVAPAVSDVPVSVKITEGEEKAFEWHTDSVIINVWDGGYFDGDKISITFDGNPILSNYVLLKEKKRVAVALPETGIHHLHVIALDEGGDPPNTATLALYDGTTKYNVVAYNTVNKKSIITIKRVR